MFFELCKKHKNIFPNQFRLPNNLILNTDEGWKKFCIKNHTIFIKGYSDQYNLENLAEKLSMDKDLSLTGNFCAFVCENDKVTILNDKDRGFPIYIGNMSVTNLTKYSNIIWREWTLTIDEKMSVSKNWKGPCFFKKESKTDQTIIDDIDKVLNERFEKFLSHNTLPLKIYLSGGIDTTLAWAYLDKFTKNYEIVDYEHLKRTYFYAVNQHIIHEHQLYNQIHLWEDPCVLVTGGCGDEYFMRGPYTAGQILKYHGYDLLENVREKDYMYKFLNRGACQEAVINGMNSVRENQTLEEVYTNVLNRNGNDFQHWHIDNTLTFTPFKDIDIVKCILQSSAEQLLENARDASIQKKLIEKTDKTKLKFVSRWKNWRDQKESLSRWKEIQNLKFKSGSK